MRASRSSNGPAAGAAIASGESERCVTLPRSRAWRRMLDWVRRAAPSHLPVLVSGESGSGKEGISRMLHRLSSRCGGPFVAISCTALTETLLDAELFGAVRGAYTGSDRDRPGLLRLADGGTLLLDEVGDMPASMQAKLLRAIEERRIRPVGGNAEQPVDVRIIAASHRELPRRVEEGAFRADLYYRLAVLQVRVPPLRERIEDLELLVDELTPRLARETGHGALRLSPEAWRRLRSHGWPGNVRELHAVLAGALLRSAGGRIEPAHLGLPDPDGRPPGAEREMIEKALVAAEGSVTDAAARIGWSRQKLYRRIKTLRISRTEAKGQTCLF